LNTIRILWKPFLTLCCARNSELRKKYDLKMIWEKLRNKYVTGTIRIGGKPFLTFFGLLSTIFNVIFRIAFWIGEKIWFEKELRKNWEIITADPTVADPIVTEYLSHYCKWPRLYVQKNSFLMRILKLTTIRIRN